ncbi:MAG: hypothetical protein ABFS23_03385 [Pseudomonadota bacterium]
MKKLALVACLSGIFLSNLLYAETDWFPQVARQAMIQDIATKLSTIDTEGKLSNERASETARVLVNGVSAKAENLGADGLIKLAPVYPDLDIPASDNPPLDAIVAYQLCSLSMDAFYSDDTKREHKYDERAWGLFLSASIYIVSTYLRPYYLDTGVTDAEAQELLHGDAMNALKHRIKVNTELLRYTMNRCEEPLTALVQ